MRDRSSGGAARWRAALIALALLLGATVPAGAQICAPHDESCAMLPHGRPGESLGAHARVFGINALLGGLTAGVRSQVRGDGFGRAFVVGAAGGGVNYGGKLLSVEPAWGAGLTGRQVASVGSSMVRNASEGRGPFEEVLLPLGPARFLVPIREPSATRLRFDVGGLVVFAWYLAESDSRLDLSASLSAGGPVFRTERIRSHNWYGNNTAGVILLRDNAPTDRFTPEMVFAHERVHLLQYDFAMHAWSAPAERWLLRPLPGGRWLTDRADLGVVLLPVLMLVNGHVDYDDRPWEREAHFFSGSW
jgi:hypothetical protein